MKHMFLAAVGLGLVGVGALLPYRVGTSSQEKPFVVRVPEEYATIQAAVDAVAEGGTVLIGPGTYQGNIKITKSIRLVGASQDLVIVESSPDSVFSEPIIDIEAQHHPLQIHLENFTIRGADNGTPLGISVIGTAQLMAHQLSVSNTPEGGFFLRGEVTSLLSRVRVEGAIRGIWSIGGSLIVVDSIFDSNGAGISVLFGSLIIARSFLTRNFVAIEIGGSGMGGEVVKLLDNTITSNEGGLYMALGPHLQIREELRTQNQAEIGASVVVMKSNKIVGNKRYGIALLECLMQPDPRLISIYLASIGIKQSSIAFIEQANSVEDNGEADLCPPDYPWPPGFRK